MAGGIAGLAWPEIQRSLYCSIMKSLLEGTGSCDGSGLGDAGLAVIDPFLAITRPSLSACSRVEKYWVALKGLNSFWL